MPQVEHDAGAERIVLGRVSRLASSQATQVCLGESDGLAGNEPLQELSRGRQVRSQPG